MSTETKPLFTEEEYEHLMIQAVTGKPQTRRQLFQVCKHAERVRSEAMILEAVMTGKLLMFYDNGELTMKRAEHEPAQP